MRDAVTTQTEDAGGETGRPGALQWPRAISLETQPTEDFKEEGQGAGVKD